MLLYIYVLIFISFQYLADASSMLASYLKVQKPVTMVQAKVTVVKARSLVECSMECLSGSCLCFSYDDSLRECGIGNCLSPNTSIGATQDFFVSPKICTNNKGFKLFTSGSVTACFWMSTRIANYTTARNGCIAKSAHLYTIKTIDKLNVLNKVYPMGIFWIGLNDIAVENEFRWEDDNTICDSTCRMDFFYKGSPDK